MTMIHEITALTGRNKSPKRKGRGRAGGQGKTCGRGTKGAKARVGKYIKRGYEGGQTPIFRRLPKRGFSNYAFHRKCHTVNLEDLNRFEDGAVVDASALIQAGLVPDERQPVKILGNGTLLRKLTVAAAKFSKSALEKIAQVGGIAQNLKGEAYELPKPKKRFVPRPATETKKSSKSQKAEAPAPASQTQQTDQKQAEPADQPAPSSEL